MVANRLVTLKTDLLAKVAVSETRIYPLYSNQYLDINGKFFLVGT